VSARSGPVVWSEAALELFRLGGPTAVSAGAGSGKTTALVELCVRLLSGEATGTPCDAGSLVAITFTERAAEELSERLREAVAERARGAEGDGAAWRERLRGLERMAVGTIHGFAGGLLRQHALEAGVDPEFGVLEEEAAAEMRLAAARSAVVAAVEEGRPAARALWAGHGGGSRAGLAALVAELARARATLGLTEPPRPAAADLEAAARCREEILGAARALVLRRAEVRTASGRKALAGIAEALADFPEGAPPEPLDLAAARRLESLAARARSWRVGAAEGALAPLREGLLRAGASAVGLAADRVGQDQARELCAIVAAAEAGYRAAKRAERVLDFDDLLLGVRDLLRRDDSLRRELRGRTRALLVDEYQDVNGLQQEIFDLLAGPDPAGGEGPALVAVGDVRQSIYRFRGADVSVFARLLERVGSSPGGRVLHLADNHRSTQGVLDLVNAVFDRAPGRGGDPPRPYEVTFGGADRLRHRRMGGMAPAAELLVGPEEGSAEERREREARAIAGRIGAIVSGSAGVTVPGSVPAGTPRAPRHAEVAILLRRLTGVGVYERALRAAGIPYRLARGGGFFQAPEVRDLGELLASLFDPGDRLAWAALLRSPLCGISDASLLAASRLGLETLWRRPDAELEAASPAELDRLRGLLAEWRGLRSLRDRLPLPDLLLRASERLDLEAALLAAPDGERRLQNLRKASAMARRFHDGGGDAAAFAARLRALAGRPPREPEADLEAGDAVAVLSVHQAKGLEWPVVFVPDLGARPRTEVGRAVLDEAGDVCLRTFDLDSEEMVETGAMRAALAESRRAAAAESRRLLYVALTRARDYLVLSGGGRARGEESWTSLVESAGPDLLVRVPEAQAGTLAAGPPAPAEAPAPPPEPVAAAPPRLPEPPPPQPALLAVTDLAEYARCPRRQLLAREMGLAEAGGAPGAPEDEPGRATARGTLVHAMLAEVDLGAGPRERRARLEATAVRRGHDPAAPGVRRLAAEVSRFLDSPGGRRLAVLARRGELEREVPFLLRVEGSAGDPSCYLTGAIDALAVEPEEVTVVDYKYAHPRPGSAERYRLQLLAYCLGAARAHPGRRVRASVQYLRGGFAAIDLTPGDDELAAFSADAPRLARGAFLGLEARRSPAELGREEGRCRAEGCGYVGRCFPPARPPRVVRPGRPVPSAPEGAAAAEARAGPLGWGLE